MNSTLKHNILEYYNDCEWQYRMMWDLQESMAISIGYWDDSVKSFKDALQYQNKVFAEWTDIAADCKVLDAGCGVGGSSIYLAKHIGCEVTGISLVPRQIELCEQNKIKHGVEDKVEFLCMDYHEMDFPDNTFDVIWAIESFCYADPKSRFIEEAYRVLKKGGRLLIIDLYQGKPKLTPQEHHLLYTKTMNPMAVESMDTMDQVIDDFRSAGFSDYRAEDISPNVIFAKKRVQYISALAFPFAKLGQFFGRFSQREADSMLVGYYAGKAFRQGLTLYGAVWGRK